MELRASIWNRPSPASPRTTITLFACVCASAIGGCTGQIGLGAHTGGASSAGGKGLGGVTGMSGGTGAPTGGVDPCVPGQINVGGSPLQRLTRDQYQNSVQDLLGLTGVSTDGITPDEKFGPFASNVAASVTDLVVDQYTRSAENLAKAALAKAKWDTLVSCDHTAMGDDGCAGQFIQKFGMRAYRRPLTSAEIGRYTTEYKAFATGGYDQGIRVVVETMLQSPNFLYRLETTPAKPAQGNAVSLNPFELATRLSFFLWNSTPDDQLLAAASSSSLMSDQGVRTQALRMLGDPRARDTIASFHTQWLDVQGMSGVVKDPATYPIYSDAVSAAMAKETVDFADYVVRSGDGTLRTLLTAPFTIAPDVLLPVYGVARPASAGAQDPVPLDPKQRAGILTQLAFLAVHGHANQSAPVQRGKAIRQNVLCEPVPDPPPNVNTTPPNPAPGATTRQRFAAHESVAACAACHGLIDNIGFGLEAFDGIGQYRTTDGGKPVDAQGSFVGTADLNGTFDGAIDMANKLANSAEVSACVTSQWLTYALGRAQTPDDACSLKRLVTAFNGSGQNIKDLLVQIVSADSFRYRQASAGGNP